MTARLQISGVGVAHGHGDWEQLAALYGPDGPEASGAAVQGAVPPVDVGSLAQRLPGVSLRRVPRYARLALLAALQARESHGQTVLDEQAAARGSLVFATAHAGAAMSCDFMDSMLESGPNLASPMAFSHAVNNMGAGLLSLLLNVRGPCHTLMNGPLSLAAALETAALVLQQGCEIVWLCVVDEAEPRLDATVPELACGEGAVCLELRPWRGKGLYITLPHWSARDTADEPEAAPATVLRSAALRVALALHEPVAAARRLVIGATTRLACTVTVGKEA